MSKGRRAYYDYDSESNKFTDVTDEVKEYEPVVEDHKKEVAVSCNNLLNVRTTPELGSFENVKCRVADGTRLELIDEVGDWYKVRLSGLPNNVDSIGYILKEFAIIV